MKANIKIIGMLMAMTIGTLAASAQSARRGSSQEENNKKSSSTQVRKATKTSSSAKRTNTTPKQQTTSRSTAPKQHTTSRSSRPKQQATSRSTVTKRTTTTRSSAPRQQVTTRTTVQKQKPNRSPQQREVRQVNNTQNRTVQNRSHKTSTTNRYNPNSNYRKANRTVHVGNTYKDPRPVNRTNSNARLTTVHHSDKNVNRNTGHYHYYPHKRVKYSVHPNTYNNHYRVSYYPSHREIIWTRSMHRSYMSIYPNYRAWHYPVGYRVETLSAFEAKFNLGEVSRVYGRVYATWYNRASDDLLLFFGGEYPNQEFTMVISGNVARKFSWRPERYFLGQHVFATGLITSFEGKAEMLVKKRHQIDVY